MPGRHHQYIPCVIYIMFGKCVDFTRGSHTLQNITITHIWPLMTYPRRMYKGKKKKNMSVVIKKKNDISLQLQWKINMSVPIQRTRYFITLSVTFTCTICMLCFADVWISYGAPIYSSKYHEYRRMTNNNVSQKNVQGKINMSVPISKTLHTLCHVYYVWQMCGFHKINTSVSIQ